MKLHPEDNIIDPPNITLFIGDVVIPIEFLEIVFPDGGEYKCGFSIQDVEAGMHGDDMA